MGAHMHAQARPFVRRPVFMRTQEEGKYRHRSAHRYARAQKTIITSGSFNSEKVYLY